MENTLHSIIEVMRSQQQGVFSLHGWELAIAYSKEEGLSIETVVFQGQHFIPFAVRGALHSTPYSVQSSLRITPILDEEESRIIIHYTGNALDVSPMRFSAILEEFTWAAEQWWNYLDEHSRGDLVYAHVKS